MTPLRWIAVISGLLGMVGALGFAARVDAASGIPAEAQGGWVVVIQKVSQATGALVAFLVFVGGWVYAVTEWGWFLGLSLGWIPSGILAYLARRTWWLVCLATFFIVTVLLLKR